MFSDNIVLVLVVVFIVMLTTIQYTLNRIFVVLKEIEKELKKSSMYRR